MINFFNIAPNDQSIALLGQIFGRVGSILPVTDSSMLLGTLFKVFNTIILLLGTGVLVYTTVVGLLATAHEGEFMGKKWSGLWVPIRSLLGIAALFPTPTGYSAIQIIFMWIIIQGVGAADLIWSTTLNFIQVAGSAYSSSSVIPPGNISTNLQSLVKGLICHNNSKIKDKISNFNNYYYYCGANSSLPFCKDTGGDLKIDPASTKLQLGPSGSCGVITYGIMDNTSNPPQLVSCNAPNSPCSKQDNNSKLACIGCKAQLTALQAILSQLNTIAQLYTQTDNEYLSFYTANVSRAPDWLIAYCATLGVSAAKCCVYSKLEIFKPLENQCALKNPNTPTFIDIPTPNDSNDSKSTNPDLLKNVYWPFRFTPVLKGTDFLKLGTDLYRSTILAEVVAARATMEQQVLTDWKVSAQNTGWLYAGSFYYKLAQTNDASSDAMNPNFTVTANPPDSPMKDYRNDFKAAGDFVSSVAAPSQTSALSATLPPQLKGLSSDLNWSAMDLMSNWMKSMSGSTGAAGTGKKNPLVEVQSFGKNLLITAEVLFAVLLTAAVLVGLAQINVFVLGSGIIGVGEFLKFIFIVITPMFMAFISALFVFGGLLAVYIPLIPYIVFAMAALGWFIGVIESMIAAPLVALGMLSPGGQHEILGRSEGALMLLLGVFLRPTLMIFGLLAAMLLAVAGVSMINLTFTMVMGDIAGKTPGLSEMIFFMAAYTFLIITILNKCFSLIHLVPERVMTWIGGQAVSYGEEGALGEVKKGVEGAGATAAGGAGAVGGAAGMGRKLAKAGFKSDKPISILGGKGGAGGAEG